MVFYGPSKGCVSCKQRRKKCDQTRPSCLRCTRANRNCGGYDQEGLTAFRRYEAVNTCSSSPPSTARRCMLPRRAPIPGTNLFLSDVGPTETPVKKSYEFALRAFFYDFCIPETNGKLSRGFLSGLEAMAYRLGPESNLVKACQAVSFFSHAKPLNRPHMHERAERLHQELLGSLARAIEVPTLVESLETRYIALLLGLYEISAANSADRRSHDAHAKGLSALLKTGTSPLDLLRIIRDGNRPDTNTPSGHCQGTQPRLRPRGIFSVPALSEGEECLDNLMLDLDSLQTRFPGALETSNFSPGMEEEISSLYQRFSRWSSTRCPGFRPITVTNLKHSAVNFEIVPGCWPGRVDTYFDLYVAGVWNIVRTSQLRIIDMMVKLSDYHGDREASLHWIPRANALVEDIMASIPYHLTDNMHAFINQYDTGEGITDRGKSLGGLLLMHPLYVASRLPFIPEKMQIYMKQCLMWIGTEMGLGQATLLAEAHDIDKSYLESGCVIIWAGFLG
ncbi:hypothetical protein LCI18_011090 [Fusarium solani-melongenae]|uniref:Uncharacterized protein n=1 Tax=Fusarium solani subsp. cucurbitae TaxID=2747967 RepID=A0ACD3ZG06_FUSSC|nr:hypothetical protein LCI18_011090 [Fusarium solani-melongenae]